MIDIVKRQPGKYNPANEAEANGEIIGRCNALHDWLMSEARNQYFSDDQVMCCILMGFSDVLEDREEYKNEKASDASAD